MCERFTFQLSAYVDDEVSASERAEIEAHLAACPECLATVRSLRETVSLAALLPEVLPPAHLRPQILARTVHRPGFWERIGVARPSVWRPAAAGAGALAVLLFAMYGGWRAPSRGYHAAVRMARAGHSAVRPLGKRSPHATTRDTVARVEELPDTSAAGAVGDWIKGLKETWKPFSPESRLHRVRVRHAAPVFTGREAVAAVERAPSGRMRTAAGTLAPVKALAYRIRAGAALKSKRGDASHAAHARRAAPAVRGSSDAPPMPPPSTAPDMMASAPPMALSSPPMGTPDSPAKAPDSAPNSSSNAPATASRPSNPISEEFTRLARRPTREQQMAQVVEDLNAAAFSHREVEWKFARLKF